MYRHFKQGRGTVALIIATAMLGIILLALAVHKGLLGVMPWEKPGQRPQIVQGTSRNAISPAAISVIDGDTIRAHGRTVRLVGFDAPESGLLARCSHERELAERATARLKALVAGGGLDLRLVPCSCKPGTEGTRSCNYGRACGVLTANGRDVGATLIQEKLARPYICGTTSCPPRQPWC